MRAVHLDGALFVAIAVIGSVAISLGSDDSAKWIAPATLWYARNIFGAITAGLLSLKMYRSTAYSKDVKEQLTGLTDTGEAVPVSPKKNGTGDTTLIVKPPAVVVVEKPGQPDATLTSPKPSVAAVENPGHITASPT